MRKKTLDKMARYLKTEYWDIFVNDNDLIDFVKDQQQDLKKLLPSSPLCEHLIDMEPWEPYKK